jgi:hypothetical protein
LFDLPNKIPLWLIVTVISAIYCSVGIASLFMQWDASAKCSQTGSAKLPQFANKPDHIVQSLFTRKYRPDSFRFAGDFCRHCHISLG